jgi:hypothetical protein
MKRLESETAGMMWQTWTVAWTVSKTQPISTTLKKPSLTVWQAVKARRLAIGYTAAWSLRQLDEHFIRIG